MMDTIKLEAHLLDFLSKCDWATLLDIKCAPKFAHLKSEDLRASLKTLQRLRLIESRPHRWDIAGLNEYKFVGAI